MTLGEHGFVPAAIERGDAAGAMRDHLGNAAGRVGVDPSSAGPRTPERVMRRGRPPAKAQPTNAG